MEKIRRRGEGTFWFSLCRSATQDAYWKGQEREEQVLVEKSLNICRLRVPCRISNCSIFKSMRSVCLGQKTVQTNYLWQNSVKFHLISCSIRLEKEQMRHVCTCPSKKTESRRSFTTRMHSSRMRTVRGSSRLLGGVCPEMSAWEVSAGGCLPRGEGGVYPGVRGVSVWGGCLPGGVCIPACTEADNPSPVDRILDTRLWKYYLSATSFADGKNYLAAPVSRASSV